MGLETESATEGRMQFRSSPQIELKGVTIDNSQARGNVLNAIAASAAAARTCYSSKGIVTIDDVLGPLDLDAAEQESKKERMHLLAGDLLNAGHLTTMQHHTYKFALTGVSRHLLWQVMHAHPFYNSEQVSQRYAKATGAFIQPKFRTAEGDRVFDETINTVVAIEQDLTRALLPVAKEFLEHRFPARAKQPLQWGKKMQSEALKKAQEVARYVRPVATTAYLYHTINLTTLMRLWKWSNAPGVPTEQKLVIGEMVRVAAEADPSIVPHMFDPRMWPTEQTAEYRAIQQLTGLHYPQPLEMIATDADVIKRIKEHHAAFDASMKGRFSLLRTEAKSQLTVDAVHDVIGAPYGTFSDQEAIAFAMSSFRNPALAEEPKTGMLSPLARTMMLDGYVFRKRFSHTADSQDQRHRMVPGSQPLLFMDIGIGPDYVVPAMITYAAHEAETVRPETLRIYEDAMHALWSGIDRLLAMGESVEFAQYLFPNAKVVRRNNGGDLLNLQHKHTMRSCLNAQEEIFSATLDEIDQIRKQDPLIGASLQPPCSHRHQGGVKPPCPEGARYCGLPIWKFSENEFVQLRGTGFYKR